MARPIEKYGCETTLECKHFGNQDSLQEASWSHGLEFCALPNCTRHLATQTPNPPRPQDTAMVSLGGLLAGRLRL